MRLSGILPLTVAAVTLVSCGGAPARFGEDFGADWQSGGIQIVWNKNLGATGDRFSMSHNGNLLCATNAEGQIFYLDGSNGELLRNQQLEHRLIAGGSCTGERVAGVTADSQVRGYDTNTGEARWQVPSSASLLRAPLLAGTDTLLLFQSNGDLRAVSLTTGDHLWTIDLKANRFRLEGNFVPMIRGSQVFFGMPDGTFYSVDYENGITQFSQRLTEFSVGGITAGLNNIGGIALSDSLICASAFIGGTICINSQNGSVEWQSDHSSGGILATGQDALYFIDHKGALTALALSDGSVEWQTPQASANRTAFTLFHNGRIIVDNGFGGLSLYDATSGELVGGHPLAGQLIDVYELDNDLIVLSSQGELLRLRMTS